MNTDTFSIRLIELIGDESKASFAKKCGFSEGALKNYLNDSMPSADKALRIADVCGVNFRWLVDGIGPKKQDTSEESVYIGIPRYDARLAAGAGAFNERARRIDDIPFTREFLQRKLGRNTADGLAILEARGDSMEPTIGDGDLVLVDRHQDAPEDGIMAFVLDDTAYVKRIRNIPDGIEVISDNRVYEPYRLDHARLETLQIIGRVRWVGRVLGR
tara:strand:+ start:74461 stop:75108 length:648 start_codon:yes stop_codon:yes gene_type:complete